MNAKDMGAVVRAAVLGMAAVTLWGLAPGCGHEHERGEAAETLESGAAQPWDCVVLQAKKFGLSGCCY